MNVRLIKSNKGRDKLFIDGYTYYYERESANNCVNWACSQRKKYSCKSRVITKLQLDIPCVVKEPQEHSHEPDATEEHVQSANVRVKEGARCSVDPSQIIRDSIVETAEPFRKFLPTKAAQKAKIRRVRQAANREPRSLEEIDIPLNLWALEGEVFILSERQTGQSKIILLGTKSSLTLLAESDCWVMDGTFYTAPAIMRQLFSIHGRVQGEIVPLVFALMSHKTKHLYEILFQELKQVADEYSIRLSPQRILCDFEKAIVLSIFESFPEADIKGCLFHFGQIIWRQVQKSGNVRKYGNCHSFAVQVRMLKSLAFVPPESVRFYYTALVKEMDDVDAKAIAAWFRENYVDGGTRRKKPVYDPKFWCIMSGTGSEYFPRTQNNVESWHRRLKSLVGRKHPGVYKLIGHLQKELLCAKAQIEKIRNGERITQLKKTIRQNKKIRRIVRRRQNINKVHYLKRIAYNSKL